MNNRPTRILWTEICKMSPKAITVWCEHLKSWDFEICDLHNISAWWMAVESDKIWDSKSNDGFAYWIWDISVWDVMWLTFQLNNVIVNSIWKVNYILSEETSSIPRCWVEFIWLSDEFRDYINDIVESNVNN